MPIIHKKSSAARKKRQSTSSDFPPAKDAGYIAFIKGLQLIAVGLNGSSCKIDRAEFFAALGSDKKMTMTFDSTFSIENVESRSFDGLGLFTVEITDGETPKASIKCEFEAHMHSKNPFPKEFADRFCNTELRLVLTPYARTFVSDLTARMAIPPVTLPLSTR